MAITLDQVFVPACLQMLGSIPGVLNKAQAHAQEFGISEAEMLGSRLAETMWPLANQIHAMWMHSAYAVRQVKSGTFHPSFKDVPTSWAEMKAMLSTTEAELYEQKPGALDLIANEPVDFVVGKNQVFKYTTKTFLLGVSMPNVYFHATTAYGILRMKGVKLGKFDFLYDKRPDTH